MGNTWVAYFVRLALTGALAAGAFVWMSSTPDTVDESADELVALLSDPEAERIPAVVESAERKTIKVPRRTGRMRESHLVEGTVRTQDGEVLEFRHGLPTVTSPSFDTVTDVLVIRDADPDSDLWLLTDTTGSLTNLGTVIQEESSPDMIRVGALLVSLALFAWAGRRYPRKA